MTITDKKKRKVRPSGDVPIEEVTPIPIYPPKEPEEDIPLEEAAKGEDRFVPSYELPFPDIVPEQDLAPESEVQETMSLIEGLKENPELFIQTLYEKNFDTEYVTQFLTLMGLEPEAVKGVTDYFESRKVWEDEIEFLVSKVFPDQTFEEFNEFIEADWGGFIDILQTGGRTTEKVDLLTAMGYEPDEIDSVLGLQKLYIEKDGTRRLVLMEGDLSRLPIGSYNISDQPGIYVRKFAIKDYVAFRQAMLTEGRNPKTVKLLEYIHGVDAVTEKYKDSFFKDDLGGKYVRGRWLPPALRQYWQLMTGAGTAQLLEAASGIAKRVDADGVSDALTQMAHEANLTSVDVPLAKPDTLNWYLQGLAQMTPALIALIAPSLATAGGAAAVVAAVGGRATLQTIASIFSAGIVSSVGEGAMEAGEAYNEALRRGLSQEEANAAFDKVFKYNVGLLSASNTAQFGLTFFMPGGKTASFLAKVLIFGFDVASEGLEEGAQLAIMREVLGDVQAFDEELWQNVKMGLMGGLGFAGAGAVKSSIDTITESKMDELQKKKLSDDTAKNVATGMSQEEAESKAMDSFAETPEGEAIISEAAQEVFDEGVVTELPKNLEKALGITEEVVVPEPPPVTKPPGRIIEEKEIAPKPLLPREPDILTRLGRAFRLADENARLGREFVESNVKPAFLEKFGDAPSMEIINVGGERFLQISTGGWRQRAESTGLEFVRERGNQGDLYRIPSFALGEGITPKPLAPVVPSEPELPPGLKRPIESLSTKELESRIEKATPHKELYQAELDRRAEVIRTPKPSPEVKAATDEVITEAVMETVEITHTDNVVEKLIQLIKQAVPVREATEQLKHEELSQRAGKAAAILNTAEGREAFQKSKAALTGVLPKAEFSPPELQLTDTDIKDLFNQIRDSDLRYFQKLNTSESLQKVLSGELPTRTEIQRLEDMFGPDLAKAILDKRPSGQKAWEVALDVLNLPRAVLASWDLSAPLRQGAILFWGQPLQSIPAFKPMMKAFFSEKNAKAVDEVIQSGKYAELREDAGLYIAPLYGVSEKITQREEAFMSRLARFIPLVSHSERAYVTYLNKIRADVFDSYAAQWEGTGKTMKDYKSLASAINIMSGRGPLGKLSELGGILNATFFSPRYQSAKIMFPVEFLRATPVVRKMMARNILAFVAGNFAILSLMKLAGADIEDDPRSSDFGKVKIGNTRLDFWAGWQQYARTITQMITETRMVSTTGRLTDVERGELLGRFVRGKLSPVAGFASDLLAGESFMGEELSMEPEAVRTQAFNRLVPMFVQDLVEAVDDSGIAGALTAMPGMFGVGVQTYGGGYWTQFTDQLGQPEPSDTLPYSVNVDDIYTTKDLWSDVQPRISGIALEDMTEKYGYPEIVKTIAEARDVKEVYEERPNVGLNKINADITEGDTFEHYYLQWQDYQKAEDKEKWLEDTEYDKYYMGNFSRRALSLLRQYHSKGEQGQKEFLEELTSEERDLLMVDPRNDWLRTNPKENAQLAVWGQAKILSLEAYTETTRLMKELDIPSSAMPEMILPPETSIETHFTYEEMASEGKHSSWEAQLLLLKDAEAAKEAGVESYAEWHKLTLSDSPIEALELKIKHRDASDLEKEYSDKENPLYIEDSDDRQVKLKEELGEEKYQQWTDDTRRVTAMENDGAKFAEAWVERGNTIDEFEAGSSEAMVWLLDTRDEESPHFGAFDWALEQELLTDDGSEWNEPVLRLNVQYREEDDWYETGIREKHGDIEYRNKEARDAAIAEERWEYLIANNQYRRDRYIKQTYTMFDEQFNPFPDELDGLESRELYADFYTLPKKPEDWPKNCGYFEDDWFLQEHPEFHIALVRYGDWVEPRDFKLVSPRHIFPFEKTYQQMSDDKVGQPELQKYRLENPEFDEWGVSIERWVRTMTEQRRRLEMTVREYYLMLWEEEARRSQAEMDELLRQREE